MTCPFCDSPDVERIGQWGGQIITAQWRCSACNSYFEAVREDFDAPPGPSDRAGHRHGDECADQRRQAERRDRLVEPPR